MSRHTRSPVTFPRPRPSYRGTTDHRPSITGHTEPPTPGAPLAELKQCTAGRLAAGDAGDEREYEMYPAELASPYRERRFAAAEQRYAALGIARDDTAARQRAVGANWECFGAPAALFCYIDRGSAPTQWADLGMYLQTVMLLLRAEGLHSCPQVAWSAYHRTVAEIVTPPEELILFCGMSIGYEDTTVRHARTGRAPLPETVTFLGADGEGQREDMADQGNSGAP
ncbi:nitroreductase family protein [Streptomyces sp. NPDC058000]|uniref:nitroreductase family protein n=1 Tax=Streptomyces sp. NPDC058000 TaxID=3346299 RepID=UPI0036E1D830